MIWDVWIFLYVISPPSPTLRWPILRSFSCLDCCPPIVPDLGSFPAAAVAAAAVSAVADAATPKAEVAPPSPSLSRRIPLAAAFTESRHRRSSARGVGDRKEGHRLENSCNILRFARARLFAVTIVFYLRDTRHSTLS